MTMLQINTAKETFPKERLKAKARVADSSPTHASLHSGNKHEKAASSLKASGEEVRCKAPGLEDLREQRTELESKIAELHHTLSTNGVDEEVARLAAEIQKCGMSILTINRK